MQDALKELEILLDPYDWFFEVEAEPRRYVVYVTAMCREQDDIIPDRASDSRQVVVHFARSKTATAQDFLVDDKPKTNGISYLKMPLIAHDESGSITQQDLEVALKELQDVDVPNLGALASALTRLEKQCGANILFDIFFEVHDGKNAVTNLGARYPEVKEAMKELYDEYGFDPIYEELEG